MFLMASGCLMLFRAPSSSVSPLLWWLGSALALCGFLPLLLKADPGTAGLMRGLFPSFQAESCQSVEPITTFAWSALFAGTIILSLYLLSSPLSSGSLRRAGLLMMLGSLAYGLVSLFFWKSGAMPPTWIREAVSEPVFGLFPNRNHTAGFLLTGAIVSAGFLLDAIQRKKAFSGLIAAVSLSALSSLLLACSQSRAGIVFLVAGLLIWFFGLGRQRPRWLTFFGLVFAVALGVLFATTASPLLKRLSSPDPSADAGGARLNIALDTMRMVANSPVTGHGKGTFPLLYPQYADRSLRYATTALHPESDWLSVLHDDGIVAVLLCAIILAFCLYGMRGGRDLSVSLGGSWPLRWGMASAFLAEILHSVIDVPLHRIELGWWILLLGGFSMSGWLAVRSASHWQSIVFKVGGVLFALIGFWLFLSVIHLVPPPPPFESLQARERVLRLYGVVPFGEAGSVLAECDRLISRYPLNTDLGHQYATFLVQEKTDLTKAKALFDAERKLLPHDADAPFEQGWILIDDDPSETIALWKEALSRQSRLDSLPGNPVPRLPELFRNMMQVASEHSGMAGRVGEVAMAFPSTRLAWISNTSCPVVELESAARDQAFMAALTPLQRGKVYEAMWTRGDRGVLLKMLETSSLAPESVPIRARFLAESGRAEEACRLIVSTYDIHLPHPLGVSREVRPAGNDIPKDPLEAARYYLGIGNSIAARRYLEESRGKPAGAPGEYYLLAANVAMDEGKWQEALQMLLAFLDATGKH